MTPQPYTDVEGRQWYSHRTFIHSQQTRRKAEEKAGRKERERLARLGVDPVWIERRLGGEGAA